MKKRSLLCSLFLVMSFLLITGCGKEDVSKTKVRLNEVAHSVFYAPMYAALELDYFKEEGLDVELITGFGADKTMTSLLSKEADIGFMGPESTIYTYQGGMEDYAVNFAQLTQRAGNFLVARKPISDFSFEQLKGKEVIAGRAGVVHPSM